MCVKVLTLICVIIVVIRCESIVLAPLVLCLVRALLTYSIGIRFVVRVVVNPLIMIVLALLRHRWCLERLISMRAVLMLVSTVFEILLAQVFRLRVERLRLLKLTFWLLNLCISVLTRMKGGNISAAMCGLSLFVILLSRACVFVRALRTP